MTRRDRSAMLACYAILAVFGILATLPQSRAALLALGNIIGATP